jgi:tetratricopeptide (TPR) repeat protein
MLVLITALLTAAHCSAPGNTSPAHACAAQAKAEAEADSEALIKRASAQMDEGAWSEALAVLRMPAAQEAGAATQLLEGICLYELGEDDEARPLLEAARVDPELAPSAELFLGLLAQRQGRAAEAAAAFSQVASRDSGELGAVAGMLLKRSRREGRLSLVLALGAGYDTNPLLSPPDAPRVVGAADAQAQMSAALTLSPWGSSGPYTRARLWGRRQASLRQIDLAGAQAGAGWQVMRGSLRAVAEYGWEGLMLGGAHFLTGHQLAAGLGWQPGATGLEASYSARRDTFHPVPASGYSGTRQAAGLMLSRALGDALIVRLGYGGALTNTTAPELEHLEHGPQAGLYLLLGSRVRLLIESRWLRRAYAPEANRSDVHLDGFGALEVDVATRWTMRAEFSAIQVRSSAPSQSYATLTGALSLQYAASLF